MLMLKKSAYAFILFLFGGIGYSFLEVVWRGFTHWTMFLLGGLCFLWLGFWAEYCSGKLPIWFYCLSAAASITFLEFVTGCVVNLGLGWEVWNYTDQPLNLMGQVCLGFTSLWFLLSIPVSELAIWMRQQLGYRME